MRTPSRTCKRAQLNVEQSSNSPSDVIEVISTSQSDEKEKAFSNNTGKDLEQITESVREWQSSPSQLDVPPFASAVAREGFKASISTVRVFKTSSVQTRKESRSQALAKSSNTSSSL